MGMFDEYDLFFESNENEEEEAYPDFFHKWDDDFNNGNSPGYYEPEELNEIIDIYLGEDEFSKAGKVIDHALKMFPDDEDMIYDILLSLNDFERWNDLLSLSQKYENQIEVWPEGHHLTALLHLGMEEDAFHFFNKMKKKYAGNEKNLTVTYMAMGEALCEVNLFDASIEVIDEAIELVGGNSDFYWIQLQCHLSMEENEQVFELGEVISKINPFDSETWHRLGMVYKEAGDLDRAIDAFEFARNLGFEDRNNLIYLMQTYEQNGNYRKALEYAVEFLNLYPGSYLINIIASNICSQMEMWSEAINFLDNAIKIIPYLDLLYLYKSAYLLHLGEQRKAKMVLKEGIKNTKDPGKDLGKELERLDNLYPNI
jgi:tetratricopeptide (TPR) repeat protein